MPTVRMASAWWLAVASGGLILWASAFLFLYAGLGLGCALGWQQIGVAGTNLLSALLLLLWISHLAALGLFQWRAHRLWRRADDPGQASIHFLATLTCLIGAVGIVSTLVTGVPVLLLPPCA